MNRGGVGARALNLTASSHELDRLQRGEEAIVVATGAPRATGPAKARPRGCPSHRFVAFSCCATLPHCSMAARMGFVRSLSDRNPKFSVAVRAFADGRCTFEIFAVSGERRTIQFESRSCANNHSRQHAPVGCGRSRRRFCWIVRGDNQGGNGQVRGAALEGRNCQDWRTD
jgi:hypothetical protein